MNKMAGTCKESGRGSDTKKDDGRETSFEMDGRCGSRPEGNGIKQWMGENAR
jgi:hypothetical protein